MLPLRKRLSSMHRLIRTVGSAILLTGIAAVQADQGTVFDSDTAPATDTAFTTMDWTPLSSLPAGKAGTRSELLCEGRYLEPLRPGADFSGDPDKAQVFMEADSLASEGTQEGELTGHVVVRQGYRQITGDTARYHNGDQIDVKGHASLREPGRLLVGEEMHTNTQTGTTTIVDARYLLHQNGLRGQAAFIQHDANGVIHLRQATYTRCPPADFCAWQLEGQRVRLNPATGLGTAHHGVLKLAGLPVLYTPWISFPLDDRRRSGLLAPRLAFSLDETSNGLDYTQPLYWNIAPNMDATVSPRFMSQRGGSLNGNFRYLTLAAQGEVEGEVSTPDQLRKGNRHYDQQRWFVDWKHDQKLGEEWDWKVRYTHTSDKDYFLDLGQGSRQPTAPTHRETYITRRSQGPGDHQWTLMLGTQHLENLNQYEDAIYSRNIDMALNGSWRTGTNPLMLDYRLAYTSFQRDTNWQYRGHRQTDAALDISEPIWGPGSGIGNANGGRMKADIRTRYRLERRYGFLEPGIRLRATGYRLTGLDQSYIDSADSPDQALRPATSAPSLYLDSGLFLERPLQLAQQQGTWTLEPRWRYLYTPRRANQRFNPAFTTAESPFTYNSLWADDRFSDSDRLGDANQLSLGMVSRVLEASGRERLRFGIGRILYFTPPRVFLTDRTSQETLSPLVTQAVWRPTPQLELSQDWIFNTHTDRNLEYRLGLHYQPIQDSLVKLGYHYREEGAPGSTTASNLASNRLETLDTNLVWPVSLRWRVMGRHTYDLTHKRYTEKILGIERDACCYMIRLLYRGWRDPDIPVDRARVDRGLFLEVVLKGLGRMTGGGPLDSLLQGISGYKKPRGKRGSARTSSVLRKVHGYDNRQDEPPLPTRY